MNDKTKWENAHFEHDANPVDGSMYKPAAAQEAVAWQVGDEFYTSESLAIEGIQQWGPSGAIAIPLYSAPVAAAPTAPLKVFSKGPWIFRETGQEFSGADLDEAAFAEYRQFRTPAAPGIDLEQFREAVLAQHAALMDSWCGDPETKEAADKQRDRLLSLIDASPKGGSFPWENFPAYLIDKCEGDTISEEGLQRAVADMAKDPRYALQATSAEVGL